MVGPMETMSISGCSFEQTAFQTGVNDLMFSVLLNLRRFGKSRAHRLSPRRICVRVAGCKRAFGFWFRPARKLQRESSMLDHVVLPLPISERIEQWIWYVVIGHGGDADVQRRVSTAFRHVRVADNPFGVAMFSRRMKVSREA